MKLPKSYSDSGVGSLPVKWWQSFKDPQLDNLIDQALQGNMTLLAAWDRLRQAQAVAVKAGAEQFPDLSVNGSAVAINRKEDGKSSGSESYFAGLVASYEFDMWGRIQSQRDAAEFEAQASHFDLQTTAITLTAQVASTWYKLVERYRQFELLNIQIATNQKAFEIITLQVRTGKVGIADMLQQQQLIEANYGEKARLEAQIRLFENQLGVLLGRTRDERLTDSSAALVELAPMPETGLPVELLQRRPDIRSAYDKVLAADRRVAAAIADKYPRISLTARLETSEEQVRDLFSNWFASLAANLTGPLLDGGFRQAEVDRSRSAASEKLHLYGQVVLEAFREVEDALTEEKHQVRYLASLNRQLDLASQAMERIREKYIQGGVDYQRVLTALLSHQQTQRNILTAKRDLIVNRINLCRALGGGWELEVPLNIDEGHSAENLVSGKKDDKE